VTTASAGLPDPGPAAAEAGRVTQLIPIEVAVAVVPVAAAVLSLVGSAPRVRTGTSPAGSGT
jgi:hypothetical protein